MYHNHDVKGKFVIQINRSVLRQSLSKGIAVIYFNKRGYAFAHTDSQVPNHIYNVVLDKKIIEFSDGIGVDDCAEYLREIGAGGSFKDSFAFVKNEDGAAFLCLLITSDDNERAYRAAMDRRRLRLTSCRCKVIDSFPELEKFTHN